MLPSDLFRYHAAPDTFRVYGEVEPFVFALRPERPRPDSFDENPTGAAREEMRMREADLPFPLLSPEYLPDEYVLVRVRRKKGHWLDAYWMHPRTGAAIKLLEQPVSARLPAEARGGMEISLPGMEAGRRTGPRTATALWQEVRRPVPIQYLCWRQGSTRLFLAAAGVDRSEAVRMAMSMRPIAW
jgi:hypothetical protein